MKSFSSVLLLVLAASLAAARPTATATKTQRDVGSWWGGFSGIFRNTFWAAVGMRWGQGNQDGDSSAGWEGWVTQWQPNFCNLENAQLPQDAQPSATPLPTPSGKLAHVLIGRGTQNYTCDLSNSTAVPAAVGAVASLYNASCIAASAPLWLQMLPAFALGNPVSSNPDAPMTNQNALDLVGHHYFLNSTTPYFSLDTKKANHGAVTVKKVGSISAPQTAMPNSVPWLYLPANPFYGQQPYTSVYRVNTAGGSPPKTCQGQQSSIQVQYAAEYWFYA